MCLILLAYRAHPDMDLLLAGNRDEFQNRPSQPPAIINSDPVIWAGKDLEAGGTWMGRNEWGLMAALTNKQGGGRHGGRRHSAGRQGGGGNQPPDLRSRGEIVMELLRRKNSGEAAQWLAGLDVGRYRPFNVLVGDVDAFYFFGSEEAAAPRALAPGYYALSNSTLDDRGWPKVERSLRFFEMNEGLSGEQLLEALQYFLGDASPPDSMHSEDPMEEIHGALGAVFIRTPGYGTVSSTILTAGGAVGLRYYFAEGAELGKHPKGAFRLMRFET